MEFRHLLDHFFFPAPNGLKPPSPGSPGSFGPPSPGKPPGNAGPLPPPSPGGDETEGHLLGTLDAGMASAENRTALRRGLAQLAESDVRLLIWYYFEDETQSRIAERLGCSQMQVSRLLAQAIQRLRPFLSPNL